VDGDSGSLAGTTVGDDSRGSTEASERALRTIVRQAVLGVSGSVEHTSGLNRITGRSYPRVEVTRGHDRVAAEVHVACLWPVRVDELAATVRDTVCHVLREHTQASSVQTDVHIGAVIPSDVPLDRVNLPLPAPQVASGLDPHAPEPTAAPAIADPRVAERAAPRVPAAPDAARVRSVAAPRPEAVRNVSAPAPERVRQVSAPRPLAVQRPAEPAVFVAKKVSAPRRQPVAHPTVERARTATQVRHPSEPRRTR